MFVAIQLRKVVVNLVCQYPKMSLVQSQARLRNGFLISPLSLSSTFTFFFSFIDYQKQPSPSSSSGSKISPAILFIIVILAVIFFISDLLHLLIRFLTKHRSSSSISESNRHPEISESDAFKRQLQQPFQFS